MSDIVKIEHRPGWPQKKKGNEHDFCGPCDAIKSAYKERVISNILTGRKECDSKM